MDNTKTPFIIAVKIILFILLLIGLYFIRDIILMLLVSILVAAIFIPLVDWLENKKITRFISTLFIYLLMILIFVGIIFIVAPIVSTEWHFFGEKIDSYYQGLRSLLGERQNLLPENLLDLSQWETGVALIGKGLFSFISDVVNWVFVLAIIFILSFYITLEKKSLIKFLISLFPEKYQNFVSQLFVLSQKDLSAWGLGMLIMMVSVGVLTYVGLLILNIRFTFILALLAGITEIIPWAGPFIGAIPAVFLALFQSPLIVVAVIILYILVQQIVNNVVAPIVMKKAVGLDPIIIIIVLLIGAKLGGILGAILSVPAAAIVAVFIREYQKLKKGTAREL